MKNQKLKQMCPNCGTTSKEKYKIIGLTSHCSNCGYTHKPSYTLEFISANQLSNSAVSNNS